jgi:hypothetical protein
MKGAKMKTTVPVSFNEGDLANASGQGVSLGQSRPLESNPERPRGVNAPAAATHHSERQQMIRRFLRHPEALLAAPLGIGVAALLVVMALLVAILLGWLAPAAA